MRIAVTGGRNYNKQRFVFECLDILSFVRPITTILHGGATGADRLAAKYGKLNGIETIRFPADWKKHGNAAGPIRNRRMLTEGKPELLVAFPGGRGTTNCRNIAKKLGIAVVRY